MNHCKDCKWWHKQNDSEHEIGICRQVRNQDEHSVFWSSLLGFNPDEQLDFCTGPDFGCVNFEARESNE